ncbi:hypothetical protein A5727_00395 [Mycobacterium sp. ACS4331]|nr:hypothetical protein A5727_00395 [Mycobacterium sp. ACS4331]
MRERAQGWSPDVIDRALIVACAVAWLLALGFAVAAGVALADLGGGRSSGTAEDGDTPWLLYTVIGVSALVIAVAVPLLLRARKATPDSVTAAPAESSRARVAASRIHAGYPASTVRSAPSRLPSAAMDRLLLRCGLGVLTAMGAAYIAVAIATHLMAIGSDGTAWALYAVAGLLTLGMAAIPVLLVRQLPSQQAD